MLTYVFVYFLLKTWVNLIFLLSRSTQVSVLFYLEWGDHTEIDVRVVQEIFLKNNFILVFNILQCCKRRLWSSCFFAFFKFWILDKLRLERIWKFAISLTALSLVSQEFLVHFCSIVIKYWLDDRMNSCLPWRMKIWIDFSNIKNMPWGYF